jgi:hypothetical protein
MIDRNESLRDQIATIVQAGYSERKTSVETADEIRSKISFLFILTGLERENDELRADKARLDWLDHNAIPWLWMSPERIDKLGPIVVTWKGNSELRSAIDAAMEGDK